MAEAQKNSATSKGAGHQLLQGATLCDLTTPVQTVVTFSISQLRGWSRNEEEGKASILLILSPEGTEEASSLITMLQLGARCVCVQMIKREN